MSYFRAGKDITEEYLDAKVTGTFEKWEPTTMDVDIKPFPLRNRTNLVPRALGKAPWAWGRGCNRTTRPI